ncbi:hypothetical protein BFJ72_g12898 [Fusarium proliferatum]|uniref:DUF676 domain-containing protein n=1 Tax=Gibberella intermedia TaxID=948311 RepID=A0A420SES3_GIBIN|nr:hypothetical protein BFJ72_g12898 [Fusarium proliferatum]
MEPRDADRVSGRVSQASRTVRVDLTPPQNGRTFRVRGVPLDWDANRLESFLADQECSTGPVVRSLATEIHDRSQSATVTFQNASYYLQAIPAGQTRSILLPKSSENQSAPPGYLALDGDFFGITTLYAPPLDDHKVDVIAISGLGGHAFGSFKERSGDYMWLRDSLPSAITKDTGEPMARVMIYGYESSVAQSKSTQTLECLATSFRDSLLPLANIQIVRPIILVGHSLGGLIIKQTLILLSKSKTEEYKRLVRAVYGIVFFGVPHDGMDISSLIPMVGDGPNRFLVESISHINSQLSTQQQEFHKSLGNKGDMEIVCFYETLESPTAKKDENGNWTMDGPAAILVTKSSATHCRQWEDSREHICQVARTHSDIVKFGPHDHEYDKVRVRLDRLVRRALTARHQVQKSNGKAKAVLLDSRITDALEIKVGTLPSDFMKHLPSTAHADIADIIFSNCKVACFDFYRVHGLYRTKFGNRDGPFDQKLFQISALPWFPLTPNDLELHEWTSKFVDAFKRINEPDSFCSSSLREYIPSIFSHITKITNLVDAWQKVKVNMVEECLVYSLALCWILNGHHSLDRLKALWAVIHQSELRSIDKAQLMPPPSAYPPATDFDGLLMKGTTVPPKSSG